MAKKTITDKSNNVLSEAYKIIGELLWEKESPKYAEEILETIHEPLIILDLNLKVILANKAFYQTFEVNPGQTRGRFIYDLGNGQWDIPKLRQLLEDILPKHPSFENYQVEHNFETIGRKIMLLNARQIPQLPKKPKIILLAIEDITRRMDKESANLAESELRYRRLFEAAQDGVLLVDFETGLIVDVNPFLTKLLGYSKEDFFSKHLWEVGAFKNIIPAKEHFEELQKRKFIRYEDSPLEAKDGRKVSVEFVSNVYDVGGKQTIQCNIRDITERKKMEQEIVESGKAKDDFLNIAAHDLRTPVSEVRASIEMILDGFYGKIPPKIKTHLQDIDKANLSLIRMIGDFLTVSRIEKGKITINPQPIDILPILDSAVKQLGPLIEKKGVKFDYEIPAKLPLVLADTDKIPEVVNNLLDNAAKFTDKGSISLKVSVKEDSVVVAVTDTGIGITKDRQKELFQKYAQVGSGKRIALSNKGTGMGLGLYISRLIIEGCKGKIWVESEPDKGSTFYFSLSVAKIKK